MRDLLDLVLDLFLGHVDDRSFDGDVGDILQFELRHDLVFQLELEILLPGQDLLRLVLILGHHDLGLHGGLLVTLRDHCAGRVRDDVIDDLGHERLAVHPAQMSRRHLAGTEALQPDLVLGIVDALHQARFHVGCRNDDLDLALQAVVERFGYLHVYSLPLHVGDRPATSIRRMPSPAKIRSSRGWPCGWRDLNPHALRHQNLNLACLPISPHPLMPVASHPQKRGPLITGICGFKGKIGANRPHFCCATAPADGSAPSGGTTSYRILKKPAASPALSAVHHCSFRPTSRAPERPCTGQLSIEHQIPAWLRTSRKTLKRYVMTFLQKIRRHRQYRETVGELSRLSDSQLADIGVERASIRHFARQVVA